MRKLQRILLAAGCVAALVFQAAGQPSDRIPADGPGKDSAKDFSNAPLVLRMMAFDKNKDGKLTRDEVTDPRLLRLFDRADANKDGVVTKEELMAVAAQDAAADQAAGRGGFGGPGGFGPGPGGFGGPGGGGPGGPPPQPGQVLPRFAQERLNLTADQKKELDALQKEVDDKLGKILTAEQKQQLKQRQERFGPGGPGGPGGRGPGGPPPGAGGGERPPQ